VTSTLCGLPSSGKGLVRFCRDLVEWPHGEQLRPRTCKGITSHAHERSADAAPGDEPKTWTRHFTHGAHSPCLPERQIARGRCAAAAAQWETSKWSPPTGTPLSGGKSRNALLARLSYGHFLWLSDSVAVTLLRGMTRQLAHGLV